MAKIEARDSGILPKWFTKVNVKPLSVNEAWQGKRFKTDKYAAYEKLVLVTLKPMKMPEPPYAIQFIFGLSSPLADYDNPIKPVQDILQKKYGFDDKQIVHATIEKRLVLKGKEFFAFAIHNYQPGL